MATAALVCFLAFLVLAFGVRSLLQKRRTGSTGFRGISGRPGSAEWLGGVLFVIALLLGLLAPVLALADVSEPIAALDKTPLHAAGVALFTAGAVATLWAQGAMGESWRIGVEADERTELVMAGPFALVRNPIFSALIPVSLGLALMVPNVVALAALIALVVALELQVRAVEEPYLRRTHGRAYEEYAARVGRFLPGIGRLRA